MTQEKLPVEVHDWGQNCYSVGLYGSGTFNFHDLLAILEVFFFECSFMEHFRTVQFRTLLHRVISEVDIWSELG